MQYFVQKLPSLILVIANTRRAKNGREHFYSTQAYLLKHPSKQGCFRLIKQGHVVVDLRMHLKTNGQVRNRGTAFRIAEDNLLQCFTGENQSPVMGKGLLFPDGMEDGAYRTARRRSLC
ncbi:MAG: hypothetical protein C4326_12845 [Ignavibacteria bacterium]